MRKMEKIKIGKIDSAVGLKGEVKIYSYAGSKERYESLARLIVATPGRGRGEKEYAIENVRYQKEMVIVKLAGVGDRNQAEALRESEVFITEDDLEELPARYLLYTRPARLPRARGRKRPRARHTQRRDPEFSARSLSGRSPQTAARR